MTATTIDQLDAICRRQTGRLIGHLRRTGQLTPQLEKDVARQFTFAFADVKTVISGIHFEGQDHERNR